MRNLIDLRCGPTRRRVQEPAAHRRGEGVGVPIRKSSSGISGESCLDMMTSIASPIPSAGREQQRG